MAGRAPSTNLDSDMEDLLVYICYKLIPQIPVPATGPPIVPATDGLDYISRLPKVLMRNIISRLPVSDAARTTVLASRWREIWHSVHPVVMDAYLRPNDYVWPPTRANSPAITAAVSSILETHPGPFQSVHLTCSYMDAYQAQLAHWLQLLAKKGVQDLILVNRPWPRDVPLPDTLFSMHTLTRLYLGLWKLPNTARLGGHRIFPRLRELGICSVIMELGDVDSIVAQCPVLETLSIQGSNKGLRLRLDSQSLRCVQVCGSVVEEITVVKAPRLERLILHGCMTMAAGLPTRVRIICAPELRVFGLFEPANQSLDIARTIITAEIRASKSTVLTNVKILSLNVRFGVRSDADLVPKLLKCFPNVKRLHIMSKRCYQSSSTRKLKFKNVHTESSMSRIEDLYFRDFRGQDGEVAFLKLFFNSADVLRTVVISMPNPNFTDFLPTEAVSKVRDALRFIRSPGCDVMTRVSTIPEGGIPWIFEDGADFSVQDPFSKVQM